MPRVRKDPTDAACKSQPEVAKVRFQKGPMSIDEEIRRVMDVLSKSAAMEGEETFDEADDFDCGDEDDNPMPDAPFEREFDPNLGREVYRGEKVHLEKHLREFDEFVDKTKADRFKKAKLRKAKPKPKAEDEEESED